MDEYARAAAKELKIAATDLCITDILSKSLDMRNKEQFSYALTVVVRVPDSYPNKQKISLFTPSCRPDRAAAFLPDRPIVVGFGPAGMFAALELIAHGIKPLIFERGKKIEERSIDVQKFIRERELNPESNIQFGEGGAGSYSDGKLFSRRNLNTSYVSRVLDTFIKFGAPKEIGYISKPHLGTDVLCKIVRNIRNHILARGGEIFYNSKMTDILLEEDTAIGIVVNGDREYLSSNIYLASGHSARDTYEMLHKKGVALEQRQIAVGVRIEHPVETINLMRYGDKYAHFAGLGAATYSLNYTDKKLRRGAYTFCMCPGGEVINASSAHGMAVVNGMSYSRRSSPFSNAALVVSCHTADYPSASPLAGIAFQEAIERAAFVAGGGNWKVPAQNLMNFLGATRSTALPPNSFRMGTAQAEMKTILPGFVTEQLLAAFQAWKEEVPVFFSDQAILLGTETRTSSPVRILRNDQYQSVNIKNLYPIGEGSGYTGGITSSAADAVRTVEARLLRCKVGP